MLTRFFIAFCCIFIAHVARTDESSKPQLGKEAPAWTQLLGTDGKLHSCNEHGEAKATLVVFLCNHCPCAKGYEKRFNEFAIKYRERGVSVIAFNSDSGETLEDMKKRAAEIQFKFDYLRDESQEIAKAFGAKTTPHVFVLDGNRKIAFSGAFDDDLKGKNVTKNYVMDAVNAILAGRNVDITESRLCGCAIPYND